MRPTLRRRNYKGIPYFYFDLADPSHERLLQKARKVDPIEMMNQITKIDEY